MPLTQTPFKKIKQLSHFFRPAASDRMINEDDAERLQITYLDYLEHQIDNYIIEKNRRKSVTEDIYEKIKACRDSQISLSELNAYLDTTLKTMPRGPLHRSYLAKKLRLAKRQFRKNNPDISLITIDHLLFKNSISDVAEEPTDIIMQHLNVKDMLNFSVINKTNYLKHSPTINRARHNGYIQARLCLNDEVAESLHNWCVEQDINGNTVFNPELQLRLNRVNHLLAAYKKALTQFLNQFNYQIDTFDFYQPNAFGLDTTAIDQYKTGINLHDNLLGVLDATVNYIVGLNRMQLNRNGSRDKLSALIIGPTVNRSAVFERVESAGDAVVKRFVINTLLNQDDHFDDFFSLDDSDRNEPDMYLKAIRRLVTKAPVSYQVSWLVQNAISLTDAPCLNLPAHYQFNLTNPVIINSR